MDLRTAIQTLAAPGSPERRITASVARLSLRLRAALPAAVARRPKGRRGAGLNCRSNSGHEAGPESLAATAVHHGLAK